MKILYHHRTQGRGGEGVHERGIIKALRALGHDVIIVSPPGIDPFLHENPETPKNKSKLNKLFSFISRHSPQVVFELLEIFYNFYISGKIKKILEKEKIDFIYERYAFFCWAGMNMAKKYKIPIILEVNEVSGIKRTRKQTMIGLAKRIERNIFKNVDALLPVSSFLKEEIGKLNIGNKHIHIISNAINIEEFNPNRNSDNVKNKFNLNGNTVIGFIGMFCEWDNLEFLFKVFEGLKKKKENIRLLLIGDGVYINELKETAKKYDDENKIIFTGFVNSKNVSEYINALDICVIPNSNPFGSPIILFEYMAMGKLVVAPKLKPIEDITEDKKDVILFEPGNEVSLEKALNMAIEDPDKRKSLGERARKKILENHTWLSNVRKIIDIYNEVKK